MKENEYEKSLKVLLLLSREYYAIYKISVGKFDKVILLDKENNGVDSISLMGEIKENFGAWKATLKAITIFKKNKITENK